MDTCRGREDERNVKAIAGIPSYSRAEEMQNHKSSFESSSAASSAPMTAPESTYHLKQITRTLCLGFPYGPTADRDCYGGRGRERRLYMQPPSFLRRRRRATHRLTHAVLETEPFACRSSPTSTASGSAQRTEKDQIKNPWKCSFRNISAGCWS